MSMNPNDPFAPRNAGATYDSQQAGQPPKKSKKGLYIALGCVGVSILGMLICCGGGSFMAYFGMNVVAEQIAEQVQSNPVVLEHIGDIQESSMDLGATAAREQENPGAGELAINLSGNKGSGILYVKQDKSNSSEFAVQSATLVTSDGQSYDIDPSTFGVPADDIGELNEMFDVGEETVPQ